MDKGHDCSPNCATLSGRLAALLDGELSLPQRRQLELHLRACPRCAAELELARRARATLRDAATRLTAPDALRARVEVSLAEAARPARSRRQALYLAMLAAAMAVIFALGFFAVALRQLPDAALLASVAVAHQQETLSAQPVTFAGSDAASLHEQLQRAGTSVDVPDLNSAGFTLVGARPDPAVATHAVTLVYRGAAGLVSCVIVPSTPQSVFRAPLSLFYGGVHPASVDGTQIASWISSDGTYVLAGNLPPAELLSLARTAASADSH